MHELNAVNKAPALTFLFWVIKIAATTLGETGGDAVSMSMNLGYLVGSANLCSAFHCCSHFSDQASEVSSHHLLVDDYRNYDCRHDPCGFCGSFSWYRLCGRVRAIAHATSGFILYLVLRDGKRVG